MGHRWISIRWLHGLVTALLAAGVIGAALAVATGWLEIRRTHPPPAAASPQAPPAPAGRLGPEPPRIRVVEEGREIFGLLGQEVRQFRYEGGDLEAWIEVEADGKTTVLGKLRSDYIRREGVPAGSGFLLWERRKERGIEVWQLALGTCDTDGKLSASQRDTFTPPPSKSGVSVSGTSRRDNG